MKLKISEDLSLPLDAVTHRLAFVGTVGSGKTYGASKLAELMLEAGAQIVVLDPVGVWYGLRLASNGKSPGFTIPVLGGLHGDVPLEPSSGNLIADLIVDKGLSIVLDVSQFEFDTDKARFAGDFAARFFFRKKSKPSAVHLFLEECQEFIPQNTERGEEKMLHAFNRTWKIGRNFGIGGSLISQRPQEVNKKALNLSQCLFAFQTMGTHERKAIESWIADKALDLDIASDLPKLKVGTPHVWAPAWLGISEAVRIGKRTTFDASETPKVGANAVTAKLAPIDLAKLSEEMRATVERAKQTDPKELQKRIRELERAKPKQVDESAITRAMESARRDAQREFYAKIKSLESTIAKQQATMKRAAESLIGAAVDLPEVSTTISPTQLRRALPPNVRRSPVPSPQVDADIKVNAGARRLLMALVQWHPNGMTEGQWRAHAGLRKTGTYTTYRSALKTAGLIEQRGSEMFATDGGIAFIGSETPDAPTTTEEMLALWEPKLGAGPAKMLRTLIEHRGEPIPNEELAQECGWKLTGTFTTYRSRLVSAKLAESRGGMVWANKETLFL
jgi:uncharacterized protein